MSFQFSSSSFCPYWRRFYFPIGTDFTDGSSFRKHEHVFVFSKSETVWITVLYCICPIGKKILQMRTRVSHIEFVGNVIVLWRKGAIFKKQTSSQKKNKEVTPTNVSCVFVQFIETKKNLCFTKRESIRYFPKEKLYSHCMCFFN